MRNFIYGLLVGIVLTFFITVANAQDNYYSGSYGAPQTYGSTTYYTDQFGRSQGSASTYGNTTYYTGPYGQPRGSASTYNTPVQPYNNAQQPNWNPYVGGVRK